MIFSSKLASFSGVLLVSWRVKQSFNFKGMIPQSKKSGLELIENCKLTVHRKNVSFSKEIFLLRPEFFRVGSKFFLEVFVDRPLFDHESCRNPGGFLNKPKPKKIICASWIGSKYRRDVVHFKHKYLKLPSCSSCWKSVLLPCIFAPPLKKFYIFKIILQRSSLTLWLPQKIQWIFIYYMLKQNYLETLTSCKNLSKTVLQIYTYFFTPSISSIPQKTWCFHPQEKKLKILQF